MCASCFYSFSCECCDLCVCFCSVLCLLFVEKIFIVETKIQMTAEKVMGSEMKKSQRKHASKIGCYPKYHMWHHCLYKKFTGRKTNCVRTNDVCTHTHIAIINTFDYYIWFLGKEINDRLNWLEPIVTHNEMQHGKISFRYLIESAESGLNIYFLLNAMLDSRVILLIPIAIIFVSWIWIRFLFSLHYEFNTLLK